MRISVVTLSFNQGAFLRQCIESVLDQDHPDTEYIVVDPGSTDGSRDIIASYGDRIIQVFERDDGPADGLNRGFSLSTGDILGFINADDYFLPGALSKMAWHFERQGLQHFVSGCGYIEREGQVHVPIRPTRITSFRYLYGVCTVFQQGTFFPRGLFARVGGFNPRNRTCWDGELFLQFVSLGFPHVVLRDRVAVFRIHSTSITGSRRLMNEFILDHKRMFRERRGRDPNLCDDMIALALRILKFLVRIPERLVNRFYA